MTAIIPRSEPGNLEAFGEELQEIAWRLSAELSIIEVRLLYHPPIEVFDLWSAVIEVWIDGDYDTMDITTRRLHEEIRALEERTGPPWVQGGIIAHWHVEPLHL